MTPDFDNLKAQRASLAGQLAGITEGAERLRFAEREETRLLGEIGCLGEAEVSRMREWAKAGAHGEAPKIDVAERTRLAGELAQAQLQAEAARAAGLDLGEEQRRVSAEFQSINARISEVALDRLEERHRGEVERVSALLAEHIADRLARACALHSFLVEQGQHCQAQGRIDDARAYFTRASRVGEASPPFDIAPSPGAVLAKMEVWSARFAELVADAPSGNVVAIGGAAA